MRVTRAALPYLIERQGPIVMIGSVNAALPDLRIDGGLITTM
ncbi:hypothetical protein Asp14428_65150 [Actinoplanes sp. NBRC 14428]|uniref:Uncharacterized protein n=1 Tax=Pseudosporangium ferrugineum TaxID=439699 RepID=A0A2T0RUA4_9ACTN|nr:hypothetical protein [Pseudosporangium ferrugineum]PRY24786.1 hypothetical protein CLV70_113228 [Pseudosporangium ferrugineum]BCJ55040.1 hypothetical protein Asp14428_65150 [Actinoplanes sp. NBRC 14428]